MPVIRSARPVSRLHPVAVLLSILPGLLWLAGCGSGTVMNGAPSPVTISANPASISAGGSSVLTVSAANSTQVTVTGSDGSSYALPAGGGNQTVTPKATTTYTAVATGSSGGKVSATTTVTVTAGPAATITLSANPTSIAPGGSSVLTVAATNATQVVVTGTDNSSYTLQPSGGTQTVTPAATTTYTAVATGAGGNVSATATVTVTTSPIATVSISASPTSIAPGGSSTLTVTAANATQVTVTGSDGKQLAPLQANGGTLTVTPAATTTYTAVATAAGGGKVSATTTVTVAAAGGPTVTISANPTSVSTGGSSVLTVTATNATQVTVTGSDGTKLALSSTGGTQTVTPTATTTYTATATGAGTTTASATATVTVIPAATVTISASPASISAGGSSVLSVTAANATQVTITGGGSSYTLSATGGTQTVNPAATTTYTATATGATGPPVTAITTVTVGPGPTATIAATPSTISVGGSSTLAFTATNATQVTITGTDGSSYPNLPPSGGSVTVKPTTTTTYTVVSKGTFGQSSATAIVTVNPDATVTISANPISISPGGSSILTITATNATQVTVTGSDGKPLAPVQATGGTLTVTPTATTVYTATATGAGGTQVTSTATVTVAAAATVTISANPTSIAPGASSVLTVTATNATQVTITGSDGTTYPALAGTGGSVTVTPTATTIYTADATGNGAPATAKATVTVTSPGSLQSITHVVFLLQENHTFDNYFGMLNPYRTANNMSVGDDGVTYSVDGIDDKLTKISNQSDQGVAYSPFKFTSACVDDMTSAWLESYGDVNRYDFSTNRTINMDGFVHTAEGYAATCQQTNGASCSGTITDLTGERAMGYYDQGFLNYYYYMASQFAVSDRWFSPMSSKSIPNRIATFTGGTTQGLAFDPGNDDHLNSQLPIPTIFGELQKHGVSWKLYYTVSQGGCLQADECGGGGAAFPATIFTYLSDSGNYLYEKTSTAPTCTGTTQDSSLPPVNDSSNSFCIDIHHIAPLASYYSDLTNGTLPSFSFIEAGYGNSDEHPGSGQSILAGQQEVASIVNALMKSTEWMQSVFFLSYDEGGGPYDHVPPVAGHTNDYTSANVKANYPHDIGSIAVNADSYNPCLPATPGTPTMHCDLTSSDPGATANDAAAMYGFRAQLGFRTPNMIISPFTRKHYVSHIPMDHTAILKFVENRFIGPSANLTARDAAQPNLLDFFDFTNIPWATPPTPPSPIPNSGSTCTPVTFGGP